MANKRKKKSRRNSFALVAALRSGGGAHKNRKDKRAEENKNPNYRDENY